MSEKKVQIIVGVFMFIGLVSVTYLAVKMGDLSLMGGSRYPIIAKFTSASGLREGAYVEAEGRAG